VRKNHAPRSVEWSVVIDNRIRRIDIWQLEITLSEKRAPSTGGQSLGAQRFPATGKRSLCGRRSGDVRFLWGQNGPGLAANRTGRLPPHNASLAASTGAWCVVVPPCRWDAESDIWDWPTWGRPKIDIQAGLAVGRNAVAINRVTFRRAPSTTLRRHQSPLNEFCRRYEKRQDVNKT
jgi:hypothetical protein